MGEVGDAGTAPNMRAHGGNGQPRVGPSRASRGAVGRLTRYHSPMPSQKTVVITGASGGIGAALALHLGHHGHRVALVARRGDALAELADGCGPRALPLVADCTVRAEVERAARARAREAWPGPTSRGPGPGRRARARFPGPPPRPSERGERGRGVG